MIDHFKLSDFEKEAFSGFLSNFIEEDSLKEALRADPTQLFTQLFVDNDEKDTLPIEEYILIKFTSLPNENTFKKNFLEGLAIVDRLKHHNILDLYPNQFFERLFDGHYKQFAVAIYFANCEESPFSFNAEDPQKIPEQILEFIAGNFNFDYCRRFLGILLSGCITIDEDMEVSEIIDDRLVELAKRCFTSDQVCPAGKALLFLQSIDEDITTEMIGIAASHLNLYMENKNMVELEDNIAAIMTIQHLDPIIGRLIFPIIVDLVVEYPERIMESYDLIAMMMEVCGIMVQEEEYHTQDSINFLDAFGSIILAAAKEGMVDIAIRAIDLMVELEQIELFSDGALYVLTELDTILSFGDE
ncbi:hypothetical protein PCE1_001839 [Barthelona sp. PCE]